MSHRSSSGARTRAFQEAVLAQRPLPPSAYDEEYFGAPWRACGERYDLESRRRIEARNPRLIKEVLKPSGGVLDVGCGPGFLMLFLSELGVEADGLDFSPRSRELAHPRVRDRIALRCVTSLGVPDRAYDLVICREVFEHLTLLQVRRTLAELCRASSRLVYVTARFHPDPEELLSLTSEPEVDPTHITLASKELVRCLFVLEGFRQRPDLEEGMDWAGKGRVLVYEREEAARVQVEPGEAPP